MPREQTISARFVYFRMFCVHRYSCPPLPLWRLDLVPHHIHGMTNKLVWDGDGHVLLPARASSERHVYWCFEKLFRDNIRAPALSFDQFCPCWWPITAAPSVQSLLWFPECLAWRSELTFCRTSDTWGAERSTSRALCGEPFWGPYLGSKGNWEQ